MRVWRICRAPFADLSGEGAKLFGGRWNSPGRAVVYTAQNPALAILEIRVHLDLEPELIPQDYVLMEIELGEAAVTRLDEVPEEPREAGDGWLARVGTPILKVPSFVAPESFNLLINPVHPEAAIVAIVATRPFSFDRRLWLPLV